MARAKYPHMKPEEVALWERFLLRLPWDALSIEYDVRVGEGSKPPPNAQPWMRKMVHDLSTKRIDAVIETADEIILVELKERASLSAVGQLLSYLSLFTRQRNPRKPVRLVCVADRVAPDMAPIFADYGIQTFIV